MTSFDPSQELSKELALSLCSNNLESSWASLSPEDFDVEVNLGVVNRIYICTNKRTNERVIIRLYGGSLIPVDKIGSIMVRSIGHEGEVLIFHLMEVNNIGPKLLGVFNGGRIEQFIPDCDTVSNQDIYDKKVMASYARKLAHLHSLKIPINKQPKDYIGIIRKTFCDNWETFITALKERHLPEGTLENIKELAQKGME